MRCWMGDGESRGSSSIRGALNPLIFRTTCNLDLLTFGFPGKFVCLRPINVARIFGIARRFVFIGNVPPARQGLPYDAPDVCGTREIPLPTPQSPRRCTLPDRPACCALPCSRGSAHPASGE